MLPPDTASLLWACAGLAVPGQCREATGQTHSPLYVAKEAQGESNPRLLTAVVEPRDRLTLEAHPLWTPIR